MANPLSGELLGVCSVLRQPYSNTLHSANQGLATKTFTIEWKTSKKGPLLISGCSCWYFCFEEEISSDGFQCFYCSLG